MASRPKGFGFTAEVKKKLDGKYDENLAIEACEYIKHYVPGADIGDDTSSSGMLKALKDGSILCNLINAIQPGSVKKINESKMAFKQMENIGNFLTGCEKYGVNKADLFQTVDLFEGQNIPVVILGIHALGRKTSSKGLYGIGPKESEKNERVFSEEQLKAGQNVIGLQMGSNKGASQAGQNFGKTRAIID